MRTSVFRALALIGAVVGASAQAQWLGQDYATYGAPMSNFISSTALNQQAMINAATPQPAASALRASAAPQAERSARELAQRFPEAQRARMQHAYRQSLEIFQQLEAKMGWPGSDLAGAMAGFVVGNYMVLAGTDVPDEHFAAVAAQLRGNPGMHAMLGGQSAQALRSLYEQCAMVGTFMALAQMSSKQHPQPARQQAHLRDAARANLQLVLGADPGRLRIGAQGMWLEGQG